MFDACVRQPPDPRGVRLVRYMLAGHDRAEIAALARLVIAEAEHGDAVARRILREAAGALAETLRDGVDQLRLRRAAMPLIGTGGIIAHSRYYWNHLCRLARTFAPRFRSKVVDLPPAVGMALCVLRCLNPEHYPQARATLLATSRARRL